MLKMPTFVQDISLRPNCDIFTFKLSLHKPGLEYDFRSWWLLLSAALTDVLSYFC